ncbi:MAG: hypothetical protein ACOC0E_01630 [Spirochaetota bacterium]
MKFETRILIYPEGDTQEIEWPLRFNQVVDVSGRPLSLPVPTIRMLAYRVRSISNDETRNEYVTKYYLEQLFPGDLSEYAQDDGLR